MKKINYAHVYGQLKAEKRLEYMVSGQAAADRGDVEQTRLIGRLAINCVSRHNPNLKSVMGGWAKDMERLSIRNRKELINIKKAA